MRMFIALSLNGGESLWSADLENLPFEKDGHGSGHARQLTGARRFSLVAVGRAVRHQRNTKKYWTLYTRTGERAFFGCFGFFGSLRCLSRLPIGVSFHVVKSFGVLATRHSSECYLAPRISRVWPDMLMPDVVMNGGPISPVRSI